MKYAFEVIYTTKQLRQVNDFLKSCDLDIGEAGVRERFSFTSKNDLTIDTIKQKLTEALRMCDYEPLHIEGGKIE
jgi:hypothetical protein